MTELDPNERRLLLTLARASIGDRLCGGSAVDRALRETELTPALQEIRATFVTLKKSVAKPEQPRLRGCIGTMVAREPLYRSVIDNARKSAFEDPRFPPVADDELDDLRIGISVLTPLEPVDGPEALVIGRDGVQFEKDRYRSVFLPQVAVEQGWDTAGLLEHLALKAGLPRDGWRGAKLSVFRTEQFGE